MRPILPRGREFRRIIATLARLDSTHKDCKLGVLAFGDSITNGGGELQWGVALQSWVLWVARATGLAFTNYAADGARVQDVVARQIPAFEQCAADRDASYDIGCLYIGVNDVRAPDWDPAGYESDYRQALSFLTARCDRVLSVTAPLDLGRPRAVSRVTELNGAIERVARELGARIVDLRTFQGRNLLMADHVHPTAFGQIAIAQRALEVLEHDGVRVAMRPASLISYETTRWKRLRGDTTYVYRHAKVSAKSLLTRLAGARRPRLPSAGAGRARR